MAKNGIFGALIGAAVVGVAWVLSVAFQSSIALGSTIPAAKESAGVRSPEGGLVAEYTVITSQTATSRETQSGKLRDVTAIDFYTGYVVVRTKDGAGTVFFADRTVALFWGPPKPE